MAALIALLVLTLTQGCLPVPPPVPPGPNPPDAITRDVVPEFNGQAVQGADVNVDGEHQVCCPGGVTTWTKPTSQPTMDITIAAKGYQTWGPHPYDFRQGIGPYRIPLVPSRPFPAERGFLTIRDSRFWNDEGWPWLWRGASMFLLLDRQMAGEDIQPQIDWMVTHGVNVARVFVAGVDWPDHGLLYTRPDWTPQLGLLADRLADAGIRLEATVCTVSCNDVARWQPVVQAVYDTLAGKWNALAEIANEPHVNGTALSYASFNRRGILSANGLDPSHGDPHVVLDYGTTHLPRDMAHFPRNSKDLFELREATGKPWVSDEPIGIAEYDKDGSGARTTNRSAVASHFALAAVFGGGGTVHSQFGLEGRAPLENEPISESLMQTVSKVWQCIPPEAQLGEYRAPHLPGFPVLCPNASCSTLEHAYATVRGSRAWVVVPMPTPGWTAPGQCEDLPIWRLE
ncbi:MAG: hypothetical protein NUW01_19875 [Gemmatimonadaceae bacterium]|nr:hypothetical protein [Gemmatimonadaceae bacterium]